MSKTLWLSSYYPTPASEVPKERALLHSWRKWTGLRGSVLWAHGLQASQSEITDENGTHVLYIDSSSCALCEHHLKSGLRERRRCTTCPLSIARGGTPCDVKMPEEGQSPWAAWTFERNPEPMIDLIEQALPSSQRAQPEPEPKPEPTHSPTPWTARPRYAVSPSDDWWVLDLPDGKSINVEMPNAEQNAKFIERCVNSHDELVALLYRVRQELHTPHDREILTSRTVLMRQISEAIAKLEGQA